MEKAMVTLPVPARERVNKNSKRWKSFLMVSIFALTFFVSFFLINVSGVEAAACTASNGNWSAVGTWSCGHVPLATDDVTIPNTNGLNVAVDTTAVALTVTFTGGNRANAINIGGTNSLTVTNAITINAPTGNVTKGIAVGTGTLTAGSISITSGTSSARISQISVSTGTITVTGNITFGGTASSARLTFSGAGTLNIGGVNGVGSGGAFTASTGTVNYNRTGTQTVGAYTYNNLTLSGSGAKTTTGATINGILSLQDTATTTGTVATYGAAATLEYKGSGAQTTGTEFTTPWAGSGGIKINNASGVTLGATKSLGANPLTIGDTVSSSIFNDGGFQLTATGTLNLTSGTLNLGTAGVATTFPAFTTRNYGVGTTVSFNSGVAQAVATTTYPNLTFSGAGAKTTASGTVTVGGNWSVTGGTATLNTNNSNVTVTGNITGTGAITSGSGTISLAGAWSNSGTFTANTGTVDYSAAAGGQTITALTYNNLTLSNSSGTNTAGGNLTVNGTLTTTAGGTLDMTAAYTLGGTLSTITNGGTIKTSVPTSTSATPIASGKTWGGTVNYASSSGAQTLVPGTFNNLTQSGSAGGTLSGNVIIGGVLTLSGGNLTTNANNLYVNSTGSVSRTSGFIIGNLRKYIATGATSKTFEIGDSGTGLYAPASVVFGSVTVAGDLTATTISGDHPSISTSDIDNTLSVNRYWTLTNSGTSSISFTSYSATFNFNNPSDLDAGANTANFNVAQYNGSTWSNPTVGTLTSTSTQITGDTTFSDFQIGEKKSNPVPTTTSISPTSKNAGDADFTLTVNGTNFIASSTVNFTGSARTTTYVSATQVTAAILTSDLTAAGTFDITVTNPTPGGGTSNAQTFTVNNLVPTTTSISPTSKNAGDTDFTLTVNGTNFISTSTVNFDGSAKTTTYVSATQLTAAILTSDLTTAGTFNVTVTNPTPGGGTSNAQTFTVNNLVPTTTSISPTSKNVGDTDFTLTINGTNFISTSIANFNGSSRTTTYVSATQVTADILTSDLTAAGTFDITVTNPTPGGGTSNAQTFTVNNLVPTTTSISPTSKNAGDTGFTLTVNGTNFVTTSTVNFAGSARTTTYVSATQVTAAILTGDLTTGGTFNITVTNPTPGGGTSNAQTFTVNNLVPTTTSISPTSKTLGDTGFTLTVNGTNFISSSEVNFAGSARTTTYVSATQVTAAILTSDLAAAGTFNITVTNPTPGGGTSNAQTFTVNNPAPTTTSISPTSKTVGASGFTLTVNGTNFISSSEVNFAGSARTTTYVSATQVTAAILTGDLTTAGTFDITVTNPAPGGGTSNAQTFTVGNPVPTTTSLSPTSKTAGDTGFTLTVNGTNFISSSVVSFSGSSRTTTYVSATQVTAAILTGDLTTAGTFDITVTNPTPGGGTSNAQTFTVNNPVPTTTDISPTSKTIGDTGFTLTVNGTNFVSTSVVNFAGSARTTTYVSATQVTAAILTSDLTTGGTFNITVTNPTPGGGTSNAQVFTVGNPVPTTTSISPTSKTVGDTGFTLTVNGTNFISSSTVNFAGSSRTTTYVSATQVTAAILTSDLTAAGTFDITVTNPTPGGGTSNAQTFTVNNPIPTTTDISPTSKTVGALGFTLTVNGANFVSSSVVNFDGGARTTTYVSATQLTATILTSDLTATGTFNITVTNPTPGGGTSNAQTFTVGNPVPTTTSISPTSKTVVDTGFTLTVNGTNFISSSVVNFAGSARVTTYVSATQVTAAILTSDLSAVGTFPITVTNPTPGGGTSNAQTFTVNSGPLDHFSFAVIATQTAGTAFDITMTAQDANNNTVTDYTGTVDLTTTAGAIAPLTSGSFVSGVRTESVTLTGTGTGKTITATDHGGVKTGTSNTFNVTPGALDHFTFDTIATQTAGTAFDITMTAQDANNNTVTGYTGTVDLTTTAGTIAPLTSGSFVSGQRTESVTLTGTGTGKTITATDHGGTKTGTSNTFTVNSPVPTTTSISPTSKTVGDTGFTLTVNGTNFVSSSAVKFNGSARTTTYISATELTAAILTSDLDTAGTFDITVTNPTPGGGTSNAQTFTVNNPAPTTTDISPANKTTGDTGFTLTVNGTNFVSSSTVNFDGSARATTFVSSTRVTAAILTSDLTATGTFNITVTNPTPGGGASNAQVLTVGNPVPTTTSISPTSKTLGDVGFTLTVHGTNFISSSVVNFAGSARTTAYVSATQVTAAILTSDLTTAGTFDITVTNPALGGGTSNTQTFTVNNPVPTTASIDPTSKTLGDTGFTLTVNGTNFISSSVVNFAGSARVTTYVSATQLTAAILTSDLTAAGTFDITVTNPTPGGGTSNAQTFTINNPAPTTTNISPISVGEGASGFTLTINGTNFASSSVVKFDGSARVTTYVSAMQLTAAILTSDLTMAGTFPVTVTNPTPGGGTSNAQTFTVTEATAVKFVIVNPTDGTVDSPITITIQAQKANNSIDTNYQQDVTLVASGSASGEGLINIANGVGTINLSDTVAETVNLSLSDSQSTGLNIDSTQDVIFAPGAIHHFTLTDPGDMSAGTRLGYTVTRKDQFGNLVTSGATTVYLYTSSTSANKNFYAASSGGTPITSIDITAGNSSTDFWYYEEAPGAYTITVSDNATEPDVTGIVDATDSVTVTVGVIAKFTLNDVGATAVGSRAAYTVTRKDQFDNLITTGANTVYLYSSSGSANKKFYDAATDGNIITSINIADTTSTANFWYFDDTAGAYTITASDSTPSADGNVGINDATDSVSFQIVATRFVIDNPTDGTIDAPITVTVKAEDAGGNTDTTYQNDITLNTSGTATGGGVVNIINGVGTIDISDTTAETINLSLSDSQTTGLNIDSTQDVIFAGGTTAQFTLNDPGNMSAGTRLGYTVTRKDQFGNLTTSGATTVYLYSSSISANKKFYDVASGGAEIGSVSITAGNSTADFWYYDETPGNYTITVSDSTPDPDGNTGINDAVDSVTISAGSIAQFILNDPGDMSASTRLGYTVTRKDQFNNLVTNGDSAVYLYTTSSGPMAFYDAAIDGNQVALITITAGSSSANFWYYDGLPGTWLITASDNPSTPDGAAGIADGTDSVTVSSEPIAATRFVIDDPADGTVDNSITVTVKAKDDSGNIDTAYQTDVTLNTSGHATGGGLVNIVDGVGTINISDTLAETVILSLSDSQTTGLNVSSTQDIIFAVGVPAILTLNDPGDLSAGARIGYTVKRRDRHNNLVTDGSTAVYLYTNSGQGKFYDAETGGSLITSLTITAGNSEATFWYYDETIGTFTVTASDNSSAPDGGAGMTDATDSVTVSPGSVAKFILNNPGDMTVSTRLEYTVTRKDAFDNLVTSGNTPVYLYTNSTGTNAKFYNASSNGTVISSIAITDGNSAANFWYYDEQDGTWTITVSNDSSAPDGNTGIDDDTDSVVVTTIPITATRFVILDPTDGLIGDTITITVQAQDNFGSVDTTYQTDVTLNTSGAATGGGLINITNGVGTINISDTTAETVNLSLSDSESAGLNVSSTQDLIFRTTAPVTPSGGGGSVITEIPLAAKTRDVAFSGRAFSSAKLIAILTTASQDTPAKQTIISDNGFISFGFRQLPTFAGIQRLYLTALDKNNRPSASRSYNLGESESMNFNNVFLSPTIGVLTPVVAKGRAVSIIGYAMPGHTLRLTINGNPTGQTVVADGNGYYQFSLNTSTVDLGSYLAKVKQIDSNGMQSDDSLLVKFTVAAIPSTEVTTDLNSDGIMNITDWSIFLFDWSSKDQAIRNRVDLNGDGKIDISDFGIFLESLQK